MTDIPMEPAHSEEMRLAFLTQYPPKIRFSDEVRAGALEQRALNNFEFITSLMEQHPIWPFEQVSFGSDLLDARRALAYQVILRQLAHARSVIVNANIRNRTGVGVALRCMLEVTAFARFFGQQNHLNDQALIELYLEGQAFLGGKWAAGSWFELERAWKKEHGASLPDDAKAFFKKTFGLPKGSEFLVPTASEDEGFAYLYSRYSEFVHPAFSRSRDDLEAAIDVQEPHRFGSTAYYQCEVKASTPLALIEQDLDAGAFTLQIFWQNALEIDPHFDKKLGPEITARLTSWLEDREIGSPSK